MTEVGYPAEGILILGFAFGLIIVSYEEHARMRGWPVGEWFTGVGFVKIFGATVAFGAVVASLVVTPWWFVFITVVAGFFIGFILSLILKSAVQFVALLGCIGCFIAAAIYI